MPYECSNPEEYADNEYHGESQECVALVKVACGAPQSPKWVKGSWEKGTRHGHSHLQRVW